jgi:hypothetical protein
VRVLEHTRAAGAGGGGGDEEVQFYFHGAWGVGEYAPGSVVAHEGLTYWTPDTTSEEPGVSGAPDFDGNPSVWARPEMDFDTSIDFTPDGSPFDDRATFAILYFPVTAEGHVDLPIDTPTDQYVGYWLLSPGNVLAATGQSDTQIGFDLDDIGEWKVQLFVDSGTPGPLTLTTVFSGGLEITPAPEENPWVPFAQAP